MQVRFWTIKNTSHGATVETENQNSIKTLVNLGSNEEEIMRESEWKDGKPIHLVIYAKLWNTIDNQLVINLLN